MDWEANCFICEKPCAEGESQTVGRGMPRIREASRERRDGKISRLKMMLSVNVHRKCRADYINVKCIAADLKRRSDSEIEENPPLLRSAERFDFKSLCLFCAAKCNLEVEKKKRQEYRENVYEVRSLTLKNSVQLMAKNRNDDWGRRVTDRVNSVICLVAEEARYHQTCYSKFSSNKSTTKKRGHPENEDYKEAFNYVCDFVEESDECQFSLNELLKKIEEYSPGVVMNPKTLLGKLKNKYKEEIVIAATERKNTVVCFRGSSSKAICELWQSKQTANAKEERLRIVKAAAAIVREDICTMAYNTKEYPNVLNFFENTEEMVPKTLSTFVDDVIIGKKGKNETLRRKSNVISHTIIAAARPRSFISPIQLGLSVYLHRKYASKLLINLISNMGLCSSYSDADLYQVSAVTSFQPEFSEESFSQFVFDNVDWNARTLDGKETFHSLGGIQCVTPKNTFMCNREVIKCKTKLPAGHVAQVGAIDIQRFNRDGCSGLSSIKMENVFAEEHFDASVTMPTQHDVLWMYGRLLQVPDFPMWQGFMESTTSKLPFEESAIIALPIVNLKPTSYDALLTVLMYAADKARSLKQTTVFTTFDQPLYMKARDILATAEQKQDTSLANVILRLGGFHLLMSYLGSIGNIMSGSGLTELWSTIYAAESVSKMLSGHHYARAIRAHFLTHAALSVILLNDILLEESDREHVETLLSDIKSFAPSFDSIQEDSILEKLSSNLSQHMSNLRENGKTAQLWLLYYKMVSLAMHFIQAERMGDWKLHLKCVEYMIPIFHASGHFPYAKACHIYLQDMKNIEVTMNPAEYSKFAKQGFFTIRRSHKFWSGIWSDMTVEQTLMRGLKIRGGVMRSGRGVKESVINKWIQGMPTAYHLCENMEKFCDVQTQTSEQHIELRNSRSQRDGSDVFKMVKWFEQHPPFPKLEDLVSISSGIVGGEDINCFKAAEIGITSLRKIEGCSYGDISLKRSNVVTQLSSVNSSCKIRGNIIQVDTTQLFQRIICTVRLDEELQNCFSHELAAFPMSLFDHAGMRKTAKSSLYKVFNKIDERIEKPARCVYVIDGGYLLHSVYWPQNVKVSEICDVYIKHVIKKYGLYVVIVFDGYSESSASTKNCERNRRYWNNTSAEVIFDENTTLIVAQDKFFGNSKNKARFIAHLSARFQEAGLKAINCIDDADLCVVETAIKESQGTSAIVVGQDIDLLVLIIHLAPTETEISFLKEGKGKTKSRIYSSQDLQSSRILNDLKSSILFFHAMSGCDTTSALYGKGKKKSLEVFKSCDYLSDIPQVFNDPLSSQDDVTRAGERFILALYGAPSNETCLNKYRFICFNKLVSRANHAVMLSGLPPTSGAARQHSLRVFHQVQLWRGNILDPLLWGWRRISHSLLPIQTTDPPAPLKIMELISCNCKAGCAKNCGCAKAGICCSVMCATCHGIGCFNSEYEDEDNFQDKDDADEMIDDDTYYLQ